MDFMQLLDMIIHVDKTLGILIANYGTMVYVVLFAIFPLLPGDTLLFIAGAFCATGAMSLPLLIVLLVAAAILGNTVNYYTGRYIGHRVFTQNYRWLDQAALRKTHAFFEHHGGKTIVLSRFIPIVRTFAPFVAGASEMSLAKFQFFNVSGALLWVGSLVLAGYYFGNIPLIRDHLNLIVLIGIGVVIVPLLLGGMWKGYRRFYPKA